MNNDSYIFQLRFCLGRDWGLPAVHYSPQLAVGCDTSTQGLKAAVVQAVLVMYNKSSFLNFTF